MSAGHAAAHPRLAAAARPRLLLRLYQHRVSYLLLLPALAAVTIFAYRTYPWWSRIANASAGPQAARFFPSSIQRSYPLDINDTLVYNAGKVLTGFSHHRPLRGNVSYGVGEVVGKTSDYYWGDFRTGLNQDLTSLLNAETRQEYDAAWEDVFSRFKRTTRYDEAQQIMTEYFQSYLE